MQSGYEEREIESDRERKVLYKEYRVGEFTFQESDLPQTIRFIVPGKSLETF